MAKATIDDLLKEQKKQTKLLEKIVSQNKQIIKIQNQPVDSTMVISDLEDILVKSIDSELK